MQHGSDRDKQHYNWCYITSRNETNNIASPQVPLLARNKRGFVFPMVIWPEFCTGQYRVNDHPHFISTRPSLYVLITLFQVLTRKQSHGLMQCYQYPWILNLKCVRVSVDQCESVLTILSHKTVYLPASSVRKSRLFIRPFISDPISKLFAVFICFNIIYLNNPDWSSKISKIFL